ncbi:hypothetical protein P4U05_18280 [Bacillus paranthracis]|uniref:hypothetical protein n=1 Tax=Bacillus cereus group TaxID=86661 RepID=UPI000200F6C9|nr:MULTISPECIES: hypothetical protein [Bacillus cereus group]ADY24965.1 hypothetical protein YBT020_29056 [Bacillus thuringiensis serovar finitimus YBT-020]MEB9692475.1 hypothetical protein [Bacillus cereus]MED3214065.1 hypothetical protein [Bacillus thuringiensis]OTX75808.1 hypothetical protein BK722_04370 [Bacillus thuringiensis serovar finitimus]MEB9698086.1 hypothetical protein [Bacillus cereus]
MAAKIFTVKSGTPTESRIRELIEEGVAGLPLFEKEVGILDFCLDLEIIGDSQGNRFFLMVSGYANCLNDYQNPDLEEITQEQLNAILPKGNVVLFAGTHELIENVGYQLNKRSGSFYEIEIVS